MSDPIFVKKKCPVCDGSGQVRNNPDPYSQDPSTVNCPHCHGTGEVYVPQSSTTGPAKGIDDHRWVVCPTCSGYGRVRESVPSGEPPPDLLTGEHT
jgi:RecJ-like exonuclease